MEFKKYTSVENSYRQKVVDNMLQYYPTEQYIVQEKIHGSNFSFYVDSTGVKVAKRSGFIDNPESFFNADIIIERFSDSIGKLYDLLQNPLSDESIDFSIHGEIYGGSYPHKDVERISNVTKVRMKSIIELKEYARQLGGDMSEIIHYFIEMNKGSLLKSKENIEGPFVAKGVHVLEHGEEFLVVDHPNPISREEYERTKELFNGTV